MIHAAGQVRRKKKLVCRDFFQNKKSVLHLQDVYKALGDTVNQTKLEHMRAQMVGFKEKLEEFAIKHRCCPPDWVS